MPKSYVEKRAEDLGLPVIDGKSAVSVVVTNSDVINAKKANSKHCALARASLRVPGVEAAYFFRTTAYLEFADRMVRYLLPQSVQKEIVSFDRARIFAPGQYHLMPPWPSHDRAASQGYGKRYRQELKAPPVIAPKDSPVIAPKAASKPKAPAAKRPRGIDDAIAKVAAQDPVNDTPEQREFERIVSGIVGPAARTPLKPKRQQQHRTQYVRDLREPK